MDHADVREVLDLAAVEPGGLDRLMAGDTPTAVAVAGHLAGCGDCTAEFGRLRRASAILREVVGTQPPPELRARTLAYVAALGRAREDASAAALADASAAAIAPAAAPGAAPAPAPVSAPLRVLAPALVPASVSASVPVSAQRSDGVARGGRRVPRSRLAWLAAAAVIVVATSALTGAAVASMKDASARQASAELEGLADVARWTLRLNAQPDVQRVMLAADTSTGGVSRTGTLTFSAGTQWLVMVAQGLPAPTAGHEYRCWVEIGGVRQGLGLMDFSGSLSYWVGATPILASIPSGSTFGVTLADVGSPRDAGSTVLSGTLQST